MCQELGIIIYPDYIIYQSLSRYLFYFNYFYRLFASLGFFCYSSVEWVSISDEVSVVAKSQLPLRSLLNVSPGVARRARIIANKRLPVVVQSVFQELRKRFGVGTSLERIRGSLALEISRADSGDIGVRIVRGNEFQSMATQCGPKGSTPLISDAQLQIAFTQILEQPEFLVGHIPPDDLSTVTFPVLYRGEQYDFIVVMLRREVLKLGQRILAK